MLARLTARRFGDSLLPEKNGRVRRSMPRPNTRTKRFIDQVKGRPVYLPISERTLEFDGNGTCVASGC